MINRRGFISAIGIAGLDSLLPNGLLSMPQQEGGRDTQPGNSPDRRGIKFTPHSLEIDGQKSFLVAGEMHYFRVPKADWRSRMGLFKDAGGNCLSTYVPWAVHEPEEGKFLFQTGDGIHDLESFFEVADSVGLLVIARPGPYVGSELKYGGIPAWLCEKYPQVQARTIDGKFLADAPISYPHPMFLEKVRLWYGQVCPLIAKHSLQHGGSVAMMQLDNELMGLHIWRGSLDYNAESMGFGKNTGKYPEFLRARYGDIADLNIAYGTRFNSFEGATPIAPGQCKNFHDLRRAKDYLDFYLGTVADYAKFLAGLAREHGIQLPLTHNAGPDLTPLLLETVQSLGKDFLLGTDSYYNLSYDRPNNPTPQASVDVFCSLEMLRVMGFPATVFEMQGGSPYDWPPIQAGDCAAWYWTHLAYGMKGSSYYIFTGGPNPQGLGETSDDYDYSAAIGSSGQVRPLYTVEKEFGNFLKDNAWLVEAHREADFRLALDLDLPRATQYWKYQNDQIFSSPEAWSFARKGLLASAFCASLSPVCCNLDADDWIDGDQLPLVISSSTCMATAKQERVIRFLEKKGCVLILPILPSYDENFEPSTRLADYLGAPSIKNDKKSWHRIQVAGVRNIAAMGSISATTKMPAGAEVLGVDEDSGEVVAWQLNIRGGGKAIFLGMNWTHSRQEHQRLMSSLLVRLGLRQKVTCSNPNIWTSLLTNGNRSALLMMNLFSQGAEADVACQPSHRNSMSELIHYHLAPMSVKYVEI